MTRTMHDSTTAADIPAAAGLVAGYLDGAYAWSPADWARFPNAIKVRIATHATTSRADVYDIETGDLTPAEAPAVWRRERAAGREPTAYVNRDNRAAVAAAFRAAGVPEPQYWLATLDGSTPWGAGVVAIQYASERLTGQHYDLSVVADHWPGVEPAPSTPGGGHPMPNRAYFFLTAGDPLQQAVVIPGVNQDTDWNAVAQDGDAELIVEVYDLAGHPSFVGGVPQVLSGLAQTYGHGFGLTGPGTVRLVAAKGRLLVAIGWPS